MSLATLTYQKASKPTNLEREVAFRFWGRYCHICNREGKLQNNHTNKKLKKKIDKLNNNIAEILSKLNNDETRKDS